MKRQLMPQRRHKVLRKGLEQLELGMIEGICVNFPRTRPDRRLSNAPHGQLEECQWPPFSKLQIQSDILKIMDVREYKKYHKTMRHESRVWPKKYCNAQSLAPFLGFLYFALDECLAYIDNLEAHCQYKYFRPGQHNYCSKSSFEHQGGFQGF